MFTYAVKPFETWSNLKEEIPLFTMANPDQKKILLKQAYNKIKEIWTKFQEDSGTSKTLLRELARIWEMKIK